MIRRHSLADISSLATADPFDSLGYPHNTYHDPNNAFTIYTLRRASSPVMLPTARDTTTTTAPAMAAPEVNVNDQPELSKAAKKKNKNKKKKKANSRNNNKEGKEGGVVGEGEGVEGTVNNVNNNASMPLIVNGASLKHRTDQVSGVTEHDEDDGLQRFINSHRAPIFTPSVATTEDTMRASSVLSENHQHQHQHPVNGHSQAPPACPEHGHALCQFLPGCCVHRRRSYQGCACSSALRSCCCVHHVGDCCYCVSSLNYVGEDTPYPAATVLSSGTPAPAPALHTMPQANGATEGNATNRNGETEKNTTNSLTQFSAHALTLLENEEFSDCRIVLKSSKDNFYPITFRAHKALIARSPRLKTILTSPSPSYHDGKNSEIEAITGETFCMVKAFETALQNLYGLPVLDKGSLRTATVTALGYSADDDGDEMLQKVYPFPLHAALADFSMCYAASGAFFEMRGVVEAGIGLAGEVLHWENVEMVLYFALCVSAFIISPQTDSSAGCNEPTTVKDLRDIYAPRLTTAALTFLINHIQTQAQTQGFTLYISAQCKCMPDRIPEHLRQIPGSILSNPKLAEVKFGSFGSLEEEQEQEKPTPETATLSAILICLPFRQLCEAFAIMRDRGVLTRALAQAVVVEREARRLYALRVLVEAARQQQYQNKHGQKMQKKGEVEQQIWELGFREFFTTKSVHGGDGVGRVQIELQREWVGVYVKP